MKRLFTVSSGFLSIIALSVLFIISNLLAYISLTNISQKPIDSFNVNEEVFVLKQVQKHYVDSCDKLIEDDEEIVNEEYEFNSNVHSYRLDENASLYKDGVFYMKFLLNDDGCAYNSYEYSID